MAPFVDTDGTAYIIYNRYSGPIHQRFAYLLTPVNMYTQQKPQFARDSVFNLCIPTHRSGYIYQLNSNWTDIVPSTLSNTTRVMEGLWMIKHSATYADFC